MRRAGMLLGRSLGFGLTYLLLWAGLVLLFAALGIRYFWGEITVGQMRLNLVTVEADGGGGDLVWIGILLVGVAPVLITAAIAAGHVLRRRRGRRTGDGARTHRTSLALRSVAAACVTAVFVGGTMTFASTVGVADYIAAANSEYDIADYYVEPTITGDQDKRNLVLIYLESGEATLEDEQLFEKDAFAPLKAVTQASDGWRSIEDFRQYEGGGWTMSGVVGTQCGVPLKTARSGSSSSTASDKPSDDVETYLGGITCLGDVLREHGYTSTFLGGASSSFAAKDTFLRDHGYSSVKGLDAWRAAGEPETNFRPDWGLSDERLLANAKLEVDALHAEARRTGAPFNLSLLTLDTHEPVHVYDYCPVDTRSEVTAVFSCSMSIVADFVEHLEHQGYLEDTAVVIMGDHLKHMSAGDAFQDQLADHPNRTVFNRIWIPGGSAPTALRPGIDQLNMYPTLLEAAGLTLAGRAAGVGVSALAPEPPEDSAQALEPEFYDDLIRSHSPRFFEKAWAGADP